MSDQSPPAAEAEPIPLDLPSAAASPGIGTIGFLGCGQMGRALLSGWLSAGLVAPENVLVAARNSAAETAERFGVRASTPIEVAGEADTIILAVKPAQASALLRGLHFQLGQVVISTVAGVARAKLHASPARLVRVMPNTACRVGRGFTAILGTPDEMPEDIERAERLFSAVGAVATVSDEALFHGITALAASGPAFLFAAMEAMADGGVAAGLPRDLARRLVVHTFAGASALAGVAGASPSALKDEVTSPAGTTIRGLQVLEARAFRGALIDAIAAAADRSRELDKP
jgi:pyrroline-5-carboxylate reductase